MPGYLRACFVNVVGNRGQGEARFHLTSAEILQPGLLTSQGERKREREERDPPKLGGSRRILPQCGEAFPTDEV